MKTSGAFFIALIACFLLGCKSDDPDPREAYVGSFEFNSFSVTVAQASETNTFEITTRPDIDFSYQDNLPYDELELDVFEFVDDVVRNSFGKMVNPTASLSLNIDDKQTATISGAEFASNEIDFLVRLTDGDLDETFSCEFTGNGKLNSNGGVTLNFEIILYTGSDNFIFKGTASGTKE